jgi:EPS-associated MarR family transcriptional regulator
MNNSTQNRSKDIDLSQEEILMTLKLIEARSSATQREIAKGLNLSLGKINYLIRALLNHGFIKVERFINSNKKSAYLYYLTPRGFETKVKLTRNYLKRKLEEYNRLEKEIDLLKKELE